VDGNEFLRKLRKLGKARGFEVRYVNTRGAGKGSHGIVYFGNRKTTMQYPRREMKTGTLRAMCRQLGIDPDDL